LNLNNLIYRIVNAKKQFASGDEDLIFSSIDIPKHTLSLISGDTGVGKTTLINILGLMDDFCFDSKDDDIIFYPDSAPNPIGYQSLLSSQLDIIHDIRFKYMGFMFQQDHLIDSMSGWENVVLPYIIRNKKVCFEEAKNKAEQLFETYHFDDILEKKILDRSPATFSGGQKQRIALIRSLIHDPAVILADEPFASVNQKVILDIKSVFIDLVKRKKISIIMVVHDTHLHYFDDVSTDIKYAVHLKKGNNSKIKAVL